MLKSDIAPSQKCESARSREAAKECSPRRQSWVNCEKWGAKERRLTPVQLCPNVIAGGNVSVILSGERDHKVISFVLEGSLPAQPSHASATEGISSSRAEKASRRDGASAPAGADYELCP